MITETEQITNSADLIDVRNITERLERLEADCADEGDEIDLASEDERRELATLTALLEELKGNGGNHEWRGAWYPITLVRESYFEDFARQEAEDLGLINSEGRWPTACIDWEQAADELKVDYSEVEFDGVTYLYNA